MRRSNEQSLKEVIEQLIKSYKLDGKLNEVKLINSWEKMMGKTIAKHTKEIRLSNKKLFLTIDSPALRQELSYAKEKMIQMLNEEMGAVLIEDIVLR